MNKSERRILIRLQEELQRKTGWGRQELLTLIGDLAIEEVSRKLPLEEFDDGRKQFSV